MREHRVEFLPIEANNPFEAALSHHGPVVEHRQLRRKGIQPPPRLVSEYASQMLGPVRTDAFGQGIAWEHAPDGVGREEDPCVNRLSPGKCGHRAPVGLRRERIDERHRPCPTPVRRFTELSDLLIRIAPSGTMTSCDASPLSCSSCSAFRLSLSMKISRSNGWFRTASAILAEPSSTPPPSSSSRSTVPVPANASMYQSLNG